MPVSVEWPTYVESAHPMGSPGVGKCWSITYQPLEFFKSSVDSDRVDVAGTSGTVESARFAGIT